MRAAIKHCDPAAEYWFEEGCYITELSNSADDEALSIARARVPPGGRTRRHSLDGIAERYIIIAGRGRVQVGDTSATVAAGDAVLIPPGTPQLIECLGDDALEFFAVCTPRFQREAYRDLDT